MNQSNLHGSSLGCPLPFLNSGGGQNCHGNLSARHKFCPMFGIFALQIFINIKRMYRQIYSYMNSMGTSKWLVLDFCWQILLFCERFGSIFWPRKVFHPPPESCCKNHGGSTFRETFQGETHGWIHTDSSGSNADPMVLQVVVTQRTGRSTWHDGIPGICRSRTATIRARWPAESSWRWKHPRNFDDLDTQKWLLQTIVAMLGIHVKLQGCIFSWREYWCCFSFSGSVDGSWHVASMYLPNWPTWIPLSLSLCTHLDI